LSRDLVNDFLPRKSLSRCSQNLVGQKNRSQKAVRQKNRSRKTAGENNRSPMSVGQKNRPGSLITKSNLKLAHTFVFVGAVVNSNLIANVLVPQAPILPNILENFVEDSIPFL
jgi:hypothetical protein